MKARFGFCTKVASALSVVALSTPAIAGGVNVIVNGDFEAGNTGFDSDFVFRNTSLTAGDYGIVATPFDFLTAFADFEDNTPDPGTLMLVANGSTDNDSAVWKQTVSVDPGKTYDFGLWFANVVAVVPLGQLQLSINDELIGDAFNVPGPTEVGQWEFVQQSWFSGTATSADLAIINTGTGFGGNDFAIDDISFVSRMEGVVIPSPTGAALAGMGLVLTAIRRRRVA